MNQKSIFPVLFFAVVETFFCAIVYISSRIDCPFQLSKQSPRIREIFQNEVFSKEEQKLLHNLPNMSEEDPNVLEWVDLLKQLRTFMKDGKEAASDEVQGATKRLMQKCLEMANGDEVFLDKLWEVRKSKEDSQKMSMYPIEEEFLLYMDEAFRIYDEKERDK